MDRESILALVVPSKSVVSARETAPEEPVRYPTMAQVATMMWCEEDKENKEEGATQVQGVGGTCVMVTGYYRRDV